LKHEKFLFLTSTEPYDADNPFPLALRRFVAQTSGVVHLVSPTQIPTSGAPAGLRDTLFTALRTALRLRFAPEPGGASKGRAPRRPCGPLGSGVLRRP
jgi:hypothetical protein